MSKYWPEQLIPDKKLKPSTRIVAFLIGLIIGCFMLAYSFNYDAFPYDFSILGYQLTRWVLIACLVLLTVFASWLIQISIRGRTGF